MNLRIGILSAKNDISGTGSYKTSYYNKLHDAFESGIPSPISGNMHNEKQKLLSMIFHIPEDSVKRSVSSM